MLQAGARFCKCLGSEFLPYLPMVMPQLLQSASLSPDVSVREQDDDGEDIKEEDEDDEDVSGPPAGCIWWFADQSCNAYAQQPRNSCNVAAMSLSDACCSGLE